MCNIEVEGTLKDYLESPKLKVLHLNKIKTWKYTEYGFGGGRDIPVSTVLDGFFSGLLELEYLTLLEMTVDATLTKALS